MTLSPDQRDLLRLLEHGPILPVSPMPGQPDYLDQFERMGFVLITVRAVYLTDTGRAAARGDT
jgi:hypothetical protein